MNPFINPSNHDNIPYAGRMQIGYDEQRYQAWATEKRRKQEREIYWHRGMLLVSIIVISALWVAFVLYIYNTSGIAI